MPEKAPRDKKGLRTIWGVRGLSSPTSWNALHCPAARLLARSSPACSPPGYEHCDTNRSRNDKSRLGKQGRADLRMICFHAPESV